MRRLSILVLLCLVVLTAWLLLQKQQRESLPHGSILTERGHNADNSDAYTEPLFRQRRLSRTQRQGTDTEQSAQPGDNDSVESLALGARGGITSVDVSKLLQSARNQGGLAEFGAALAMDGSRESITLLLKAIASVEGDERSQLSRSLQALHTSEASAELQAFMVQNSDEEIVAVQARDALARTATGKDVLRMSQSLPSEPEQGLARSYLLGTLARVRNPEAVPQLADLCLSKDPAIYTSAAIALGGIGTPEAVTRLVTVIEKRAVADMNDAFAQALLSAANKDSRAALIDTFLSSTNAVVRYATFNALVAIEKQSSDANAAR